MNINDKVLNLYKLFVSKLESTPIYHGTNSYALNTILDEGLKPGKGVWNINEMTRLKELIVKNLGESFNSLYSMAKKDSKCIYLISNYDSAKGFARRSPEIWYHFKSLFDSKNKGNLSSEEFEEAKILYSSLEEKFGSALPVVVKVSPKAPLLRTQNRHLSSDLKKTEKYILNADSTELGYVIDSIKSLNKGWPYGEISVEGDIDKEHILGYSFV